eukprot:5314178-Prorocentrum_lima.AAC.1
MPLTQFLSPSAHLPTEQPPHPPTSASSSRSGGGPAHYAHRAERIGEASNPGPCAPTWIALLWLLPL